MSGIKVKVEVPQCDLRDYIDDYKENKPLVVERHWNQHKDLVVLKSPEGETFTVSVRQLRAALDAVTSGEFNT